MEPVPFHPEWLIHFWTKTPVIQSLDPHLTAIIVVFILSGVGFYYYAKSYRKQHDNVEVHFQQILRRKRIVEEQLAQVESEYQQGKMTEEAYEKKLKSLDKYLKKVKEELLDFTS